MGDDDEFDFHDFQILGHVYFELGDFKTALHWYSKFETAENRCPHRWGGSYLEDTGPESSAERDVYWANPISTVSSKPLAG